MIMLQMKFFFTKFWQSGCLSVLLFKWSYTVSNYRICSHSTAADFHLAVCHQV